MLKDNLLVWVLIILIVGLLESLLFFYVEKQKEVRVVQNISKTGEVSIQNNERVTVLKNEPIKILFGGDMMFDRHIRDAAKAKGNDFIFGDDVRALMREADLVVANLEGPVTDHPSKSAGSKVGEARNFYFTFDPSWARTLYDMNVRVVNIGNNHILNFGHEGLEQTSRHLEAAGVEYFGLPRIPPWRDLRGDPLASEKRWLIKEMRGVRIAFVNYNQFMTDGEKKAFEDIATVYPQTDVVIVYTHWGVEYVSATLKQKELAHRFIEAGADAVIGSHPHIVQEKEIYKDKTVYYSLGNFIFDQYFRPEMKAGLLVEMTIDPESKSLAFRDIPIILKSSGQTTLKETVR